VPFGEIITVSSETHKYTLWAHAEFFSVETFGTYSNNYAVKVK
jgi:hypothetical protein